jgi:uncharacterized Zn finger protein
MNFTKAIAKKCPGCGEANLDSIEVFDYGKAYLIHHCKECGMIFNFTDDDG